MAYRHSRSQWVPGRPRRWLRRARTLARAAGFWLAVVLPFGYLPVLALGPASLAEPAVIGAVVGVNLMALVVGHAHEPALGRRRRGH